MIERIINSTLFHFINLLERKIVLKIAFIKKHKKLLHIKAPSKKKKKFNEVCLLPIVYYALFKKAA